MKFIKPNFKNNILNISASLAEFLGCPNKNPTLKILKEELGKGYKNVVFIIFDGLGINPLKINLGKDSFLRKNIKKTLTSTFPSTTTCATTTMLTNKYPLEHGWLGWSMHFEELSHNVDVYLSRNSQTKEPVDPDFVKSVLPYEPYYKHAKTDYTISKVVPPFWHDGIPENRYTYEELEGMFNHIESICKSKGKQFIYSYCPEPDHEMHEAGVTSIRAKVLIESINKQFEDLATKTKDTLFVVTADHGQTDVKGDVDIYEDNVLANMLEWVPCLEPRATVFKVKEGKNKEFEKHFKKTYGKDFKLFKTETLLKKKYFGEVINQNKKYLGDYIAVCKTDKIFYFNNEEHFFKGYHTSLGKEMLVPLIIYGNKIL